MVNPRVIRNAIKYGPVIAGAAKRYGPTLVQEARKHAPGVVDEVERRTGRRVPGSRGARDADMADATPRQAGSFVDNTPLGAAAAKRRATHHARTVVDGSMLQTFLLSRPVWVVFSGDTPVGTHPHVDTPFSELLRHADMDARIRPRKPGQASRPGGRPGAGTSPQAGDAGPGDQGGPAAGPDDDEPLTGTVHTP
ncbi:hypothetical protein [Kytococcus sedentarius]|uniref:hypothetical protein n=1 Tax=Kytococcus sedentarius TaxID=1276 RepID=UPI0035BBEFAE